MNAQETGNARWVKGNSTDCNIPQMMKECCALNKEL